MTAQETTVVLLHSPLVGPATWRWVLAELAERGVPCAAPSLLDVPVDAPGYWEGVTVAVKRQVGDAAEQVVLVGHSGVGPALPRIGEAFDHVAGYVFADASLPFSGGSWLKLMPAAMQQRVAAGELSHVPNMWTEEAIWKQVGVTDPAARATLCSEARALPVTVFAEPFEGPANWTEAPAGYLAFEPNPFYVPIAEEARSRGWPVRTRPGSHFHMVVDPPAVAASLLELLGDMGIDVPGPAK